MKSATKPNYAAFERHARKLGMRTGVLDRSHLSFEPTVFVDYEREGWLVGSRPLPRALRDFTSATLVAVTGMDELDTPATRFIGIEVIADMLGITPPVLRGHMKDPSFPRNSVKRIGWLSVTGIDSIMRMLAWLEPRRVGPYKNHICQRDEWGRAAAPQQGTNGAGQACCAPDSETAAESRGDG